MSESLRDLYAALFGADLVTGPVYLALAVVAAWLVWRRRHRGEGFWRWLLPRRIWAHPSHLVDLQLFVLTRVMAGLGVLGGLTVTTVVAAWVAAQVPAPLLPAAALGPVLLALILWLPTDFAAYWMHRLYHRWGLIWPLHAVHHSAAVMTPITTYRQHPLAVVLSVVVQSAVAGAIQGLLVGALRPDTAVAEIAGINACFVLANAALAALHHSHVWLSFGPVLERLIISPAQHQIHHSQDPAHHDRNFGTTLAVWDWMFGTLYVTRGHEALTFGLAQPEERPLMSQRLWPILWDPVRRLLRRPG